jgi:hypothetical protein
MVSLSPRRESLKNKALDLEKSLRKGYRTKENVLWEEIDVKNKHLMT